MARNIKIRLVGHVIPLALIARFSLLSSVVSLASHLGGEGARQNYFAGDNFEDDFDHFVNSQLEPLLQSRDNSWVAGEFPTDDWSLHSDQSSHHLSNPAEPRNGLVSHPTAVPKQFEGSSSSPSVPPSVAAHNLEADMHHSLGLEPLPHRKRLRITPEFLGSFGKISAPIFEDPATSPWDPFAFGLSDPQTHNPTLPVVARDFVAAQEAVASVKLTQPRPPVNLALPKAHQDTFRNLNKNGAVTANNHVVNWVENSRSQKSLPHPLIPYSKELYQRRLDAEVEASLAKYDEMLGDSSLRCLISAARRWHLDNPSPQNSAPFKQFHVKLYRKMEELKETRPPLSKRLLNVVPEHPIVMIPTSRRVKGPQDIFIRLAIIENTNQRYSKMFDPISKYILSLAECVIIYHRMGSQSNIWRGFLGTGAAMSEAHLLDWLFGMIFEETHGSLPLLGTVTLVFPAPDERAKMFGALQKFMSQVLVTPGLTKKKDTHKPSLIILYAWYFSSVEKQIPVTADAQGFWRAITRCILPEIKPSYQLNSI
ncbi:hypothetical protein VP01_3759g2 [Puccinia sorghi]|uniref:Uncharacterized protein n=1 Tax=Puccinia sorghi TaxID=27349 RepID=A0A0L6UVQ6_9BASI|nr:hypothetical protein VP01_3759g2 [Puccinia sorghi]